MPQDEEFRKSTHSKTKPKTYQWKSKEAESLKKKAYTFSCNNFRIVEFYFLRCWVFKLGIIMIKCFTPKSVAEFSTQVQIIYTYQKTGQTVWPWQSRLQQLFSLFIKDFQISTSASESFFPISFSNTFQRFNPFNVNVVLG